MAEHDTRYQQTDRRKAPETKGFGEQLRELVEGIKEVFVGEANYKVEVRANKAASEIRETLKKDPVLASRFDWSKSSWERPDSFENGFIIKVPGTGNKSPARFYTASTRACDGNNACVEDVGPLAGVVQVLEPKSGSDFQKDVLPEIGVPILKNVEGAFYRAAVAHELEHADRGTHEFGGIKKQFQQLAKEGVIAPVTDEKVLEFILRTYPLETYAVSVIEWRGGKIDEKTLSWLPGGKDFQSLTNGFFTRLVTAGLKLPTEEIEPTINGIRARQEEIFRAVNTISAIDKVPTLITTALSRYYTREFLAMKINEGKSWEQAVKEGGTRDPNIFEIFSSNPSPIISYREEKSKEALIQIQKLSPSFKFTKVL